MPNYSKNDVILIRYPFSDFQGSNVRPAEIVSVYHVSEDVFITPLTSKTHLLFPGEFTIENGNGAGLNVPTAVKRGLYTVNKKLIVKQIGRLSLTDAHNLEESLRLWLGL